MKLYMPISRWRWCLVYDRVSIEQGTQHNFWSRLEMSCYFVTLRFTSHESVRPWKCLWVFSFLSHPQSCAFSPFLVHSLRFSCKAPPFSLYPFPCSVFHHCTCKANDHTTFLVPTFQGLKFRLGPYFSSDEMTEDEWWVRHNQGAMNKRIRHTKWMSLSACEDK